MKNYEKIYDRKKWIGENTNHRGIGEDTNHGGMTGKYGDDFAAANKRAGHSKTPDGYTWYHTEQVKTIKGQTYNKLELVKTDVHDAARHSGGAQIYKGLPGNSGAY